MVMFTASQWQELELQSLIFKYMATGIPVPSDLVLGIRRSLFVDSLHPPPPPPSFGWGVTVNCAARDMDPEPGRCRRTDGKKWRCSKEAYPDSKYCERHMHRGKSRSRKPVEFSSPPSAATAAASSSNFPPPPRPLSLSTLNLPLLPFSSSRPASSQPDSSNRNLSGVNQDSTDHFNPEKAAKLHCFLDEKPRKIEGSWMNLDMDQWKASAEHEDTALYLNVYGSS